MVNIVEWEPGQHFIAVCAPVMRAPTDFAMRERLFGVLLTMNTYETGVARFYELARGQISGDHDGVLKLIFCPKTKKLLGVHIIGERATEMSFRVDAMCRAQRPPAD